MHQEAWQRVYVGIRHMHREHFVFSNPTCTIRRAYLATFFYLCRGNAGVAQSPVTRRRQP